MKERVHQDIVEALNNGILPHIIGIQDMDTPCLAQLWVDGSCIHQEGVAMFNVGEHGYLTAEYFGYDNAEYPQMTFLPPDGKAKLIMEATGKVIPVWDARPSRKASTRYSRVELPTIKAYALDIQGWLGKPQETQMRSASITLTGLPDLRLPKSNLPAPDEEHEIFTMRGLTSRNAVLVLEADGWIIRLSESRAHRRNDSSPLYHALLTTTDGSLFTLGEDDAQDSILDALNRFLSFQCGRWITISTIMCAPPHPKDWVVSRGFTGRLVPPLSQLENDWIASEWREWPMLFREFWKQCTGSESRHHLRHAVHHYVECQKIFAESAIDYALVAAQSTLQALVRWWNDLDTSFRFGSRKPTFRDLLVTAADKAELGMDRGAALDVVELREVSKRATKLRNDIDHGRGGDVADYAQSVVALGRYYHNLARFLLLAKLGYRGLDTRGDFYSPSFVERPRERSYGPDSSPEDRNLLEKSILADPTSPASENGVA